MNCPTHPLRMHNNLHWFSNTWWTAGIRPPVIADYVKLKALDAVVQFLNYQEILPAFTVLCHFFQTNLYDAYTYLGYCIKDFSTHSNNLCNAYRSVLKILRIMTKFLLFVYCAMNVSLFVCEVKKKRLKLSWRNRKATRYFQGAS